MTLSNTPLRSAAASGIKEKPSRASVASRVFESLVSSPASKVVHQRKASLKSWNRPRPRGSHSGTEFLEGFRRNRKNLQWIFFLTKSSSDSARADCEFSILALERGGGAFCCAHLAMSAERVALSKL